MLRTPLAYFARLSIGRAVLWCYFIWYLVMIAFYFDRSPRLWLTSAGLSVIIGLALVLSVTTKPALDRWQLMRLFLIPFCVSSFSALVKDHSFILVFSPKPAETLFALALCGVFCAAVTLARRFSPSTQSQNQGSAHADMP